MRWHCNDTLDLFRGRGQCELCWRDCPIREPHHIYARGRGDAARLDIPINLISFGKSLVTCGCHSYIHTDATYSAQVKRDRLLGRILRREGLEGWYTVDDIWDILLRLVALPPDTTEDELEEMGLLRWFLKPKGKLCRCLDR